MIIIQNGDHAQFEAENVSTPPEKRSDWPYQSFDAEDWAKAFCKVHPQVNADDALGWFASALMRGYDQGMLHLSRHWWFRLGRPAILFAMKMEELKWRQIQRFRRLRARFEKKQRSAA